MRENHQFSLIEECREEEVAAPPATRGRFARGTFALARLVLPRIWPIEISGRHHLPASGPLILCPNHESALDPFCLVPHLPAWYRNNLCVIAKEEVFMNPVTHRLTVIWGGISINRFGDFISALCTAIEALHQGLPVLIYPEGTRSRTGTLQPFQRGAARLALITGAPLIPIKMIGLNAILPPKHRLPTFFNWKERQRMKIRLIFGEPLYPPKNESGRAIEIQLTEQLRQAVADLGSSQAALLS